MSAHRLPLLLAMALLGGCVTTLPYTVPVPVESPNPLAPATLGSTDAADTAAVLARMQAQISQLQQQVAELQNRQTALSQSLSVQTSARPAAGHGGQAASPLSRAQQQYRAGLYAQAVRTLAGADSGGNGSAQAQAAMWLLAQSHERLNHCESAINIGNRFVRRFPRHANAADALWLVGQCQWRMQQQDIARDTWRKLMHSYPDSAAARRAAQHLQQGR